MTTATALDAMLDRMLTMSRAMDESVQGTAGARPARQSLWLPPVDCFETGDAFVIAADLPGVHPENVDISFEQNTLTIKGTRAPTLRAPEQGELRVFTAERVSGGFARSIRLPEYVDGEKIEARYAEGVLTITVPKSPSALPRKIAIASAEPAERAMSAGGAERTGH